MSVLAGRMVPRSTTTTREVSVPTDQAEKPAELTATQRDGELGRLGPPTSSVQALSDREVLLAGRRARIAENQANGERWLCFVEFYRRRLATEEQKKQASPHFELTARQETVVEVGSLWGMDAGRVRKELNVALHLCQYGDAIWGMCLAGQLDGYRASLIADAARQKLDTPDEVEKFMTGMLNFLRKHLTGVDGDADADPLVTCTDHRTKHAPGFSIEQAPDGSYLLRTAAGFSHRIERTTHPVSEDFSWPDLDVEDFQFSATEIRDAIEGLRDWAELNRPRSAEQHWEDDFDEGLTEEEMRALYGRRSPSLHA
jgi:hypothetical protein